MRDSGVRDSHRALAGLALPKADLAWNTPSRWMYASGWCQPWVFVNALEQECKFGCVSK